MAETGTSVEATPQTEQQIQQAAAMAELDAMMKLNLQGVPPQQNINGIEPTQTVEPEQNTEPIVEVQPQLTDTFSVFREKFGWNAPEEAIKEVEELRAFKAAPQAEPLKFENADSEKLFKAIVGGKMKEVYDVLAHQTMIDSLTEGDITEEKAEAIIKFKMKVGNDLLTKEDIEFQYKQQYALPKEPVQRSSELDEEFTERHDEWKERVEAIKRAKIVAAKIAVPSLQESKSKLVIPEIEQTVDQEYVQWKKLMDEQAKLDAQIQEAYKTVTPKDIETKLTFNDEANKIKFDFQYEPDAEGFKKTVQLATNIDSLLQSFVGSDGKFDQRGFLTAMDFALNREKYLLEAMKQSKNATIKSLLPDNSGGTQRQFPQTQAPDELGQMMQMAGIGRSN